MLYLANRQHDPVEREPNAHHASQRGKAQQENMTALCWVKVHVIACFRFQIHVKHLVTVDRQCEEKCWDWSSYFFLASDSC